MFDSVLRRDTLPKRRFGSGAIIAILIHTGVISFAVWAQASGAMRKAQDVAVTFVKPPPPPPPPPPAAPRQARPKVKPDQPRTVLQQAIVAPTVIPDEKPPEQDPVDRPSSDVGEGAGGGEVGGVPGGIVGGVVESAGPLEFDAKKMTDAKFISGPNPRYTDKALEREVQGVMVVKCVISTEGHVHDCRVLKSLPFMDRAVIEALERRRYAPVTMGGRPIEVDYTFRIKLELPQ